MFIEQYLGKSSIEEITKEDLINFFSTERIESDKLEFKAYIDTPNQGTKAERDKKKTDSILQTICAFLNSDGGLLIWGAPKGQQSDTSETKETIFKGELTGVSISIDKDQFIGKISDSISPTPLRVKFGKINLSGESYCYLFEVLKSDFAPHQIKGTYYMRLDGSTRPAPHHYVEALIKKISFPRLEGYITFGKIRQYREFTCLPFVVSISNLSKTLHDKNIQHRLISKDCSIYDLAEDTPKQNFAPQNEIYSKIRDIIHYNIPSVNQYFLVTNRLHRSQTHKISLMLIITGELSPAIFCKYEIEFSDNAGNGINSYKIVGYQENEYFFEKGTQSGKSERDLIKESDTMYLNFLEEKMQTIHDNYPFLNP